MVQVTGCGMLICGLFRNNAQCRGGRAKPGASHRLWHANLWTVWESVLSGEDRDFAGGRLWTSTKSPRDVDTRRHCSVLLQVVLGAVRVSRLHGLVPAVGVTGYCNLNLNVPSVINKVSVLLSIIIIIIIMEICKCPTYQNIVTASPRRVHKQE